MSHYSQSHPSAIMSPSHYSRDSHDHPNDHDKKKKQPKQAANCSGYIVPIILILFLFGILLWDLKRVKDISDVIHDDHHQLWKPMNSTQLSAWYSMKELCILEYEQQKYTEARTKSINNLQYVNTSSSSSRKSINHEIPKEDSELKHQSFANMTTCVSKKLIQATYDKITPKSVYDKFNSLYSVNVFAKFKCNFGSSIGSRQCLPPYYSRKYYTESLHSSSSQHGHGYQVDDDPTNQALQRIFMRLDRHKQPLIFLSCHCHFQHA